MKYDLENELEFKEKERDFELLSAGNGLSSDTKVAQKYNGITTFELHWNPKTKQLVELESWWVANGEDDVNQEFEVRNVYNNISSLAMLNKKYENNRT